MRKLQTGRLHHPFMENLGPAAGGRLLCCPSPIAARLSSLLLALSLVTCLTANSRLRAADPTPSAVVAPSTPAGPAVLKPATFQHYIETFNRHDRETVINHIPNAAAWAWLTNNIPLFECPDTDLEEIYYFRWWTYRKHIKHTPDGFIVTEFLPPVPWAGKHNSINCPAGHHFYEGRWLHDPRYLDDYAVFWFRKGGEPRKYSFWAADSIYARRLVSGDPRLTRELLLDLIANYEAWEKSHLDGNDLFWQNDGNDGMEVAIGGSGCRATINSYQYGDALAIARIAEENGQPDLARTWRDKASALRQRIETMLWDPDAQFFKVLPRGQTTLANVRELHGYTPWYFGLPGPDKSVAWRELMDPLGFYAPFGPTTAEQRHPGFTVAYEGHECQWNGPSWPLATSVTLTALANLLNDYTQDVVSTADYWRTFQCYLRSHRFRQLPPASLTSPPAAPDNAPARLERRETRQPWIDENLNPYNGDWIARTLLQHRRQPPDERGKDYNHSTFCDLVITGVIGLRPRSDDVVEVNPLVPAGTWDYFCLDNVRYHGRTLTILYDRTGTRYGRGAGLQVLADGRRIAHTDSWQRVTASLASPASPLQRLALSVEPHTLNPVREPHRRGRLTLTGFRADGTQRTFGPAEAVITARTKEASGNVTVATVEGLDVIPHEGGIATLEATVTDRGQQFTATTEVVVAPFYRDYHQTLVLKLFLGMEGKPVPRLAREPLFQRPHDVLCTFAEALEVIRKTDHLTRGIPKIVYLVGWQKGGHDHGYPSWDEVNPKLKRPQDPTARDSLRWLIREARQYHTTVSLHLNMVDAYQQSPLWEEYVAKDCLARDATGQLLSPGIQMEGEPMYNVVYPKEWEAGLAQRRIDRLIALLPELLEGHTIHVDVFIAQRAPDAAHPDGAPISPWHAKPENGGLTPAHYVATQRQIFRYWRDRGFDVTGEGIFWAHPPGEGFTGLQSMSWWYPGDPGYQMRIPECLMARGRTDRGGDGDFRFGSSMHGEEIYIRDKDALPGFLGMFCRTTLPWYYLSRLQRLRFEQDTLFYSDDVVARTEDGKRIIRRGEFVLREDDNLFVPVLWQDKEILAYSREGYRDRPWRMPAAWQDVESVDLYQVGLDGCTLWRERVPVSNGTLRLSLERDGVLLILPTGRKPAGPPSP